jgi:hypothetical protein
MPPELRDLPRGRYVLEPVDDVPELTAQRADSGCSRRERDELGGCELEGA